MMIGTSVSDFFFKRPPRKYVIVSTALVVSQTVAVMATHRLSVAAHLTVSLVLFTLTCAVLYALHSRLNDGAASSLVTSHSNERSIDVLGTPFSEWDDDDVSRFIVNRRIAVTGAGDDLISDIARDLIRHRPAAVYLLDGDVERLEQHMRFLKRVAPQLPTHSATGNLDDPQWLEGRLSYFAPDMVLDLTAYRFLKSKVMPLNDPDHYDEKYRESSAQFYRRYAVVRTVLKASTEASAVSSILFALPKTRHESVVQNWVFLYTKVLRDSVREVAAHLTTTKAVVSVWKPRR
jgi:hypothetical protein